MKVGCTSDCYVTVRDVTGSKHQQTAGTKITNNTFYKVALLHSHALELRKVYTADSAVVL